PFSSKVETDQVPCSASRSLVFLAPAMSLAPRRNYTRSRMLFAAVVETSRRVAGTSRRLEKIDLLAALLRQLDAEEVEIVVAILSGYTRQGRIGIGWATLRGAEATPADSAGRTIHDLDRALGELKSVEGAGSERRRRGLVHALMFRGAVGEQPFVGGLLMGGVR